MCLPRPESFLHANGDKKGGLLRTKTVSFLRTLKVELLNFKQQRQNSAEEASSVLAC